MLCGFSFEPWVIQKWVFTFQIYIQFFKLLYSYIPIVYIAEYLAYNKWSKMIGKQEGRKGGEDDGRRVLIESLWFNQKFNRMVLLSGQTLAWFHGNRGEEHMSQGPILKVSEEFQDYLSLRPSLMPSLALHVSIRGPSPAGKRRGIHNLPGVGVPW